MPSSLCCDKKIVGPNWIAMGLQMMSVLSIKLVVGQCHGQHRQYVQKYRHAISKYGRAAFCRSKAQL